MPALVGLALLVGCSSLIPEPDAALPIEDVDLEQRPGPLDEDVPGVIGPITQVASGAVSGEQFTLSLYQSADGYCLALSAYQYRGSSCGPRPGEGLPDFPHFGPISQSGLADGTIELDGTVTSDVEAVWVATEEGNRANAVLTPADFGGVEASVFFLFLPEGAQPVRVVAADASGDVIDEFPIMSVAPGGPAAPPTPDA